MLSRKVSHNHNTNTGKIGEEIATSYLIKEGYKIISRNFRIRGGEIDVIAKHDKTLVFVEVKTRTQRVYGLPEESITPSKVRFLIRSAMYYSSMHGLSNLLHRIDAIIIEMDRENTIKRIEHIKNISGEC